MVLIIFFNCILFLFSDCFQTESILAIPEIATNLIHMLGSFISGSQVYIKLIKNNIYYGSCPCLI